MAYNSKYTGEQVEELLDSVNGKQDLIEDLDAIREGASKGATALQSIPSEYVTENDLNKKVDKVTGKGLSTEDFTTALKTKLESLSNYDDTQIENAVSSLQTQLNTLVGGNVSDAIESFNEIIAFLDGIADTEDLNSIIASIEQQIANKANADSLAKVATSGSYTDLKNQPTIPSAVTESTVSGWGFTKNTGTYSKPSTGIPKTDMASAVQTSLDKADTALQSYTEQYKGTITGVSANGASVATSGVANIPAASTSAYGVTKLSSATNSTSTTLAATPSAVKSAYDLANGKYTRPSTGIPFSDFEEQVQGSIIKAEESVQSVSMSVTTGNATAGNFFSVNKDANGNVSIQMIQNTLASGKIAIPYTTDVKQYIDNAVANAGGGGGTGGSGIPAYREINHGTNETTITIMPNEFHVWDEVSDLTIAFEQEMSGYASEYLFQFTSGATPTTLTLPNDIKWAEELVIETNRIYQVSILKGLASVLSWKNAPDLIENHITYNEGNFMNGGTITFEYPTASELTFTMDYYSSRELLIPQGTTNMTIDWFEPRPPQIISISPTNDSTYKYIFA